MRLFADTNWLVATYFNKVDDERSGIVGRFARVFRQGQPMRPTTQKSRFAFPGLDTETPKIHRQPCFELRSLIVVESG